MGNHDVTVRRKGKDKQKDTFNKYGKNTTRGVRIALEMLVKNSVKKTDK